MQCVRWKYDCWIRCANNGTAEIVPKATAVALVRDDGVIVGLCCWYDHHRWVAGSPAMPGDILLYVVPVGDLSIIGVTVAAHKVLLPVELDARALELRKVWTTHGNNVESCRVVLLGAVAWTYAGVGTVVGAVIEPAPVVVVRWETKGNACRADDNLRTHHCS